VMIELVRHHMGELSRRWPCHALRPSPEQAPGRSSRPERAGIPGPRRTNDPPLHQGHVEHLVAVFTQWAQAAAAIGASAMSRASRACFRCGARHEGDGREADGPRPGVRPRVPSVTALHPRAQLRLPALQASVRVAAICCDSFCEDWPKLMRRSPASWTRRRRCRSRCPALPMPLPARRSGHPCGDGARGSFRHDNCLAEIAPMDQ
jgi:hypothetical protein